MKRTLFSLVLVLSMVQSSVAYMATNSPEGAWRFSSKARMSSSPSWYTSSTGDLANLTFHEYVTYDPENRGRFADGPGGGFKVFETWIMADDSVVLSLQMGGDDGYSLFVDGLFVEGGGFAENANPVLELQGGRPRRLVLASNNAMGGWQIICRARVGDSGDYVPFEDIEGICLHAEGDFSDMPTTGPVAYYPLDGNANDASGNGHHGTVFDATLTEDRNGNPDSAYRFMLSEDRIDISSIPNLQTLTISAWFRTEYTNAGAIVGFDGMYALLLSDADMLRGDTKAGSSPGGTWTGGPTATNYVSEGEWHHAAWSRASNGDQELYLDGQLVDSGSFNSGTIPSASFGGFIGLYRRIDGVYSGRYQGDIDDVRIYDRALSSNEVAELYTAEAPVDLPTTAFLVADADALTPTEAEYLKLIEEGGSVAIVGAASVRSNEVDLLEFDALCCFTYGAASLSNVFDAAFCDRVFAAVEAGATLVVNRQAGGTCLLLYGGYRDAAESAWNPAFTDSHHLSGVVSNEPLLEGVCYYEGSPSDHPLSYWRTEELPSLMWRVDNTQTYSGYYTGTDFITEPDGFLASGFAVYHYIASGSRMPYWYRGKGRIIQVNKIGWTFDQATRDGGYVGAAGRQILRNLPTLPRFDHDSLTSGPVLHYRFDEDEGAVALDASGNDHTGSVFNATWTAVGRDGGAYEFDGSGDYIRVPHDETLNPTTFTVCAWVQTYVASNQWPERAICGKHVAGIDDNFYWLMQDGDKVRVTMRGDSGDTSANYLIADVDPLLNEWAHVACSYDGSTKRLYVNGVEQDAVAQGPYSGNAFDLLIGAGEFAYAGGPPQRWWKGKIDDFRLYDRPLSSNEVAQLHAVEAPEDTGPVAYYSFSGNADDESGNGHHGIVREAVLVADRLGVNDKAYSFDGVNDGIDISSLPKLQTFSMCAWFRTDGMTNSSGSIIGFDGMYKIAVVPDGDMRCYTKAGSVPSGSWTGGTTSTVSVADGAWHHVAWSRGADGYQKLYLDGALHSEGQFNSGTIPSSNYGGYIGMERMWNGFERYFWDGDIDEVRFYDRVITSNEVTQICGVPPASGDGPVLHYTFDSDDGTNVWDASGNGNDGYLVGGVTYEDSISGKAVRIDQATEYVRCDSADMNVSGWDGITVSTWILLRSTTTYGTVICRNVPWLESRSSSMGMGVGSPRKSYGLFGVRTNEADSTTAWSTTFSADASPWADLDRWYHLVGTYDGSNASFYVDGVLESNTVCEAPGALLHDDPDTVLAIGKMLGGRINWSDSYLNGLIDEVKIFDYALSAAEVTALTEEIRPTVASGPVLHYTFDEDDGTNVWDSSGNGNHGTVAGNVVYENSLMGKAPRFTSSSSYIVCPSNELNISGWSGITVSTWVKMKQWTTYGTVIARSDNFASSRAYNLDLCTGNGSSYAPGHFTIRRSATTGIQVPSPTFSTRESAVLERWYHICGTYDGTNTRYYVDGRLDAEKVMDSPDNLLYDHPESSFLIGRGGGTRFNWSDDYLNGLVDDVRIYNYALSSDEVAGLYRGNASNRVSFVVTGDPEAHGVSLPSGYGTNSVVTGAAVTETVSSPVAGDDGIRYVCTGWSRTGSIPENGSSNSVEFTITEDSSLTWLWERQVKLAVTGGSGGSVSAGGEWFAAGSQAELVAVASNGYEFVAWQGDVPGHCSTENPLSVTMVEPRAVEALFRDTGTEPGLIAYYPFRGNAQDESGNGNHGTVNGAVLTEDRYGEAGKAYMFDGVNDYIDCGNVITGFSNYTILAWVSIRSYPATGPERHYVGPWSQALFSYPAPPAHYEFYTSASSFGSSSRMMDGTGINTRVPHILPLNEWHLVSQTYDGDTVRQYDNAELVNEVACEGAALGNGYDFLIGKTAAYPASYLVTAHLDATIDEVRVYDRVLSSNEVAELYTTEAPVDPPTTAFLVADTNALSASEREFLALVEAGGDVALLDAAAVKSGEIDLLQYHALCSFGYATDSAITGVFDQAFCEYVYEAVEAGATLVVNRQAEGTSLLIGGGYSEGRFSRFFPVYTDSRFVSAIESNEPLLEAVVVYTNDPTLQSISYWHSVDSDSMLWRVDNRQSYPRFFCAGDYLIDHDGHLIEGFTSSTRVYGGERMPFWYRGRGRVVVLSDIHWTFDQSTGDGGTVGVAGQQILKNLATLPRFDNTIQRTDFVVAGIPECHGVPSPHGYGTNSVVVESEITETVNSPVMDGEDVRYACTGWSGTGSVPENGSGNSVAFTITEDSSLTWLWERQVKLAVTGGDGGSVSAGGGWFAVGRQAELVAVASNGYEFVGWQGDVPGHYSTENPLAVTMDGPREVKALFWGTSTELGQHWVEGGTYFPGINKIECRFYVPNVDDLLSLVWRPELPAGWSLVGADGDGGPYVVAGDVVFTRNHVSNPVRFRCLVSVPAGDAASQEISAVATYQVDGMSNPKGMQVVPHPLVVDMHASGFHSADYQSLPWVIDAHELNRVLSYWRAGYYRPDPEGLDGFVATTKRYRSPFDDGHSADFSPGNWRINAREANRVLAYWRAGGYRIDPYGKDGFAPVKYGVAAPSANSFASIASTASAAPAASIASIASAAPIKVMAAGGGYEPGGTVVITNTVSFESSLLALAIRPDLPDGWTLQDVQAPANPEWTDAEILWTGTLPSSPVTIVMTINVPVTSRGDRTVEGVVDAYEESATNSSEIAVPPVGFAMDAADADGDGLPDAWESAFSRDGLGLAPDVDSDHDGLTNWKEWYAGTDPTNAASSLIFGDVEVSGGVPQLSWQSAQDRTYSVLFSSNLVAPMTVLTNGVSSTPPTNSMSMPTSWPKDGFFRIMVE